MGQKNSEESALSGDPGKAFGLEQFAHVGHRGPEAFVADSERERGQSAGRLHRFTHVCRPTDLLRGRDGFTDPLLHVSQ